MHTNLVNQRSYDLIADEYNRKYNNDSGERSLITYLKLFPSFIQKGARILDLGCASGVNVPVELSFEPSKIVGVDISQKMIDLAVRNYGSDKRITFLCNSFQDMELKEQFDVILAILSFVHVPMRDLEAVLAKVSGLMAEGGFFMANYFVGNDEEKEMTSTGWGNNSEVKRMFCFYREDTLRSFYGRCGLEIVSEVNSPGNSFNRINILAKKK